MKMNLSFLIMGLLCLNISIYAQIDTIECDYPDRDTTEAALLPWFGNNDYLENLLDSIGYPAQNTANRIIGSNQVRYHVPIKFWVYRNSNGIGGPTLGQLQNYIDNLNRFYNIDNNTWIGFYMKCDIGFIDDDDHLTINNDLEAWSLIQNHKEKGCINIHITNELDGATGVHYRSRFFGIDAIFLSRITYTNSDFFSTIAHEVGHYFELDHTHQYSDKGKCRKEAIDRNRTWPFFQFCFFGGGLPNQRISESTGDFLRDTPADHDLNSNNSCNYVITGQTDPWGDHYETPPSGSLSPDTRNLLSYNGDRGCRITFSRLQIAVMLYSIERGKSQNNRNAWKDLKAEYDEYEPDNTSEMARQILLGEIQERNFHQQILMEDFGGYPIWSQCDVDWVRFVAPCSGNFDILTAAMFKKTKADTKLTLFDANLNQLAVHDNISGTNLYSNIIYNMTSGQTYFIRVENLSVNTTGYYTLRVIRQGVDPAAFQITGANTICLNNENYSISNLPGGASVSWSALPQGLVSINPLTGNPTTLSKLNNGNLTLTATVSNYCGNASFNISKAIKVGTSDITILGPYDPVEHTIMGIACLGEEYYFEANDIETGQSYTWTLFPPPGSSNYPTLHSGSTVYLTFTELGYYTLRVSKTNSCGSTYMDMVINVQECYGLRMMVSPNPAKGQINVTIDEKANKKGVAENIKMELLQFNTGAKQKQWSFDNSNQKQFTLGLQGIRKGVYILKVTKGKLSQSVKIIIEE